MPLTGLQRTVLGLLAQNRSPDSYLAGGAALHFAPDSRRFTNDLDFFHDSEDRVASAFSADADLLRGLYYSAARDAFVVPEHEVELAEQGITVHFGSPGGVLPLPSGVSIAPRDG